MNEANKTTNIILVLVSCVFALAVVMWIFVFRKSSYDSPERILPEAQVSNYSSQHISEPCELIDTERIPADKSRMIPPKDVYTYKSKDRDMSFHVISTLEATRGVFGSVPVYEPVIYDDHEICGGNQAADDFWLEHEFNKDFYSIIIKIPVDDKDEAGDYLMEKYAFRPGWRECVSMPDGTEMIGARAAMYVSGVFTSAEDNKYEPYIWYDEMSVGNGEVALNAQVREYGEAAGVQGAGSGKEAYHVAVVFVAVNDLDPAIKGGFTNVDYDSPVYKKEKVEEMVF